MASNKRLVTAAISSTLIFSLVSLASAVPGRAQATPPPIDESLIRTNGGNATDAPTTVATSQPQPGDPAASPLPQASTPSADDAWHFAVSPYLWFAGVHGTAVGPKGNGLGFRASPSDLLSHFRLGLLAAAEVRRQRLVMSTDLLWMRLGDDKALPFPGLGATSANMTANVLLLTPKVGVRIIDQKMIKVDGLGGFRYWHFGESLHFNPSILGLNFSRSQNFVDPLVGGRIQMALSPKIVVNILGDVGGWGTGSQLEYQVGGFLGYRIKPAWTLQAGYRYLNLDYGTSRGGLFNLTLSGVLFGVTWNLK